MSIIVYDYFGLSVSDAQIIRGVDKGNNVITQNLKLSAASRYFFTTVNFTSDGYCRE